uniref:Uncharacterized protein n=1 Tax=Arundo donax TaxID=35708 RepID=A0A0A8ZW50_ARUDO
MQRQPTGELHHVLHPGQLRLGPRLRHPLRRHGHVRRGILLLQPTLRA